jgi:aminopeptidase C
MNSNIDLKKLEQLEEAYRKDDKNTILRHALSNNQFFNVIASSDDKENANFHFSIDIKTLPVSNQKKSGRCWIFSACNVLREIIAKKLDIQGQFELSQNYISYYDKLEKYNYYMEGIIDLAKQKEPHDSRKVEFLLRAGVSDGGQWDMFVNLVKKYGIVPKSAFLETAQSEMTYPSSQYCNGLLRQFAAEVYEHPDAEREELENIKEKYFSAIYSVFTSSFGIPCKTFDFSYRDSQGQYHCERNLTPHSFFDKYIGNEIDEYVSLIHAPTKDKKYNQTYTVELVGNVYGGKDVTHFNVPFSRLEELIIEQLKHDQIVWFGSDVSYFNLREEGLWDEKSFDYVTPFGYDLVFDKAQMLDFYHSAMNHAMVITGVNLVDGKPTRWKIENSWGDQSGKKGYYAMGEEFFTHFVYQAAIKKCYLNEDELKALEKKPEILPPWDPFGTLA